MSHITKGISATSRAVGSAQALDVSITDGSGNQITSFGGAGGTSEIDDAAFTPGADLGTPMMGVLTADTVDSGDVGVVGIDAARNLKVSIEVDNVGIGGGIQYTEGDTDSTIVGTALLWEDAADTLKPVSAAAPLPVAVGTVTSITNVVHVDDNGGVLTVDGSITANAGTNLNTSLLALEAGGNLAGAATSLAVVDDWDESDRAKVNPIVGQAGVAAGSGVVSLATQRVVLATDVALPAGTNAIGKLAANSGVDIGDVDVTSVGGNVTVVQGTATNLKAEVIGTGTFAVQATIAAAAASIAKAEDAIHADGDVGVPALAVRDDTLNIRSGAENDYEPLHTDANGALWTHPTDTIAHGATDAGNGIKITAVAESSPKGITLVADTQRTNLYADLDGMQMTKLNTSFADILADATSNTDGNSTASTVFTAVASTKNYITAIHVFRTDAGTTPIYIDFRSGTAGSVLWRMVLPPNGGSVITSPTPLFATAANTALAYDVSAATTTVYINVSGFQSKA